MADEIAVLKMAVRWRAIPKWLLGKGMPGVVVLALISAVVPMKWLIEAEAKLE